MASQGYDTVLPACSLEFCPSAGSEAIFTVGTYKLEDPASPDPGTNLNPEQPVASGPQRRRGECLVLEVGDDAEDGIPTFHEVSKVALPAILDMKWCHRTPDRAALLGIADSEGRITLHEWESQEKRLSQLQTVECAALGVLCLSIDWSNRREPTSSLGSLAVSLSDQTIAILRPDAQNGLSVVETWHAHDFEPWIVAWDYWNTNVLYSGGDDLKLKGWDVRQGFDRPTFVNKRFDGGVTAIQSHPYVEHLMAVGSYDASVRLFDVRKPTLPIVSTEVGGGVWRVKWHPTSSRKDDLLVACMHDGFKVLHYNDAEGAANSNSATTTVTNQFNEHKSLAYGVDWSFAAAGKDGKTLIGSCSFYDHLLHVWRS